jgi:hypothetical protein
MHDGDAATSAVAIPDAEPAPSGVAGATWEIFVTEEALLTG